MNLAKLIFKVTGIFENQKILLEVLNVAIIHNFVYLIALCFVYNTYKQHTQSRFGQVVSRIGGEVERVRLHNTGFPTAQQYLMPPQCSARRESRTCSSGDRLYEVGFPRQASNTCVVPSLCLPLPAGKALSKTAS